MTEGWSEVVVFHFTSEWVWRWRRFAFLFRLVFTWRGSRPLASRYECQLLGTVVISWLLLKEIFLKVKEYKFKGRFVNVRLWLELVERVGKIYSR